MRNFIAYVMILVTTAVVSYSILDAFSTAKIEQPKTRLVEV